ncbi:unnamed protein product [Diatraea saccharalis]|uniref:Uncharacterized protein n=1 Tax=Diatraea saccharalis TaxID=40085 RepID=A0A9N9R0T9_9NEOP|nr:unnamed protein product [Diatraea saccharalis]
MLRSEDEMQFCLGKIPAFICRLNCPGYHICLDGLCRCINEDTLAVIPDSRDDQFVNSNRFIDYTARLDNNRKEKKRSNKVESRPALRHHIAHFCPNLDDARVCIRTCMKTGKPAFCGKDHRCYCGHKYSAHSKDTPQDANATYAQFKDMYEKYFGKEIDSDYFFGGDTLRSEDDLQLCLHNVPAYICHLSCPRYHICLDGTCRCVDAVTLAVIPDYKNGKKRSNKIKTRPVLRHHIAHFCSNLDVARVCIRNCMKMGKPAFCGKDHKCYCGHKYSAHSKETPQDADATYSQFKDIYEKYFGKGYVHNQNI